MAKSLSFDLVKNLSVLYLALICLNGLNGLSECTELNGNVKFIYLFGEFMTTIILVLSCNIKKHL